MVAILTKRQRYRDRDAAAVAARFPVTHFIGSIAQRTAREAGMHHDEMVASVRGASGGMVTKDLDDLMPSDTAALCSLLQCCRGHWQKAGLRLYERVRSPRGLPKVGSYLSKRGIKLQRVRHFLP